MIKRGWRIGTQLIIAGEYFINYHKDEQNNYISATKAVISMDLK